MIETNMSFQNFRMDGFGEGDIRREIEEAEFQQAIELTRNPHGIVPRREETVEKDDDYDDNEEELIDDSEEEEFDADETKNAYFIEKAKIDDSRGLESRKLEKELDDVLSNKDPSLVDIMKNINEAKEIIAVGQSKLKALESMKVEAWNTIMSKKFQSYALTCVISRKREYFISVKRFSFKLNVQGKALLSRTDKSVEDAMLDMEHIRPRKSVTSFLLAMDPPTDKDPKKKRLDPIYSENMRKTMKVILRSIIKHIGITKLLVFLNIKLQPNTIFNAAQKLNKSKFIKINDSNYYRFTYTIPTKLYFHWKNKF